VCQALVPLIGAIAAGNTVFLKLSRHSQQTAAKLSSLLVRHLDMRTVAVEASGGASMITTLMEQRWDHVFFTGSCSVGKIVYQKAAVHLTPVTLELGGKNPCIVDDSVDVSLVARRIAWYVSYTWCV
jgi:aldehyde dehydrogenase (NAD+)